MLIQNKEHVYTIELNEGQRRILETALNSLATNANQVLSKVPESGSGGGDTEYEEFELLLDMIVDIPRIEQENGTEGVIHSLSS